MWCKRGIIVLLLGVLSLSAAQAQLVIEVTQGLKDATPIAIVPFAAQGGEADEDVAGIISADLHRSGMFRPLPSNDLLSRPTTEQQIIYRDFRVLGVPYLVIGQVNKGEDGNYSINYGLYDANQQRLLIGQTYQATSSNLRNVAHAIADKIFEQLTGVPGVFGTKLLYITHTGSHDYPYQLQYADADGERARTILRSKQPIMSPAWSPDAKKIAYVSFENDGLPVIYIHTLASGERQIVSRSRGINGAPAWSPDGTRLALTLSKDGNPEIYVLDLETNGFQRLTNDYAIDTEPCWMPDGKTLLFTSSRSGGPQIYQVNVASGAVKRITFNGRYNSRPSITPDGRFLVYVHRNADQFNIAVQDLVRNTFQIVTQTQFDESPSVAPNGSMVVYGAIYQGKNVLEAVSIDGRVKVRLPSKEGDVSDPAWSPYLW